MSFCHTSRFLKLKLLLQTIGLGLSFLFLFFYLVSLAKADGPVVDLSLDEQDAVIRGGTDHGWLGEVTGSADFNGDGYDDLLIGETGNNYNGTWSGAAYMILGSETLSSSIDLAVTRPNLTIYGAADYDVLGHSVAGGDLNGDGYHDMIVGADYYNGGQGAVYVVLGHNGGLFSTPITMDLAITSPALSILGEFSDGRLGRSVASADINNDNFDDIIIGSYTASPGGRIGVGAVYVILGNSSITSTTPTTVDLSSQSPALIIYGGDVNDRLGRSVSVGDVNGDNIADIIAGAYWADVTANNEGETYIFYGSGSYTSTSPTTIDLDAGASPNVTIRGVDPGDESGFYVGSGDLNNDTYDDVLIGAYRSFGWNNASDEDTGEVYVVYGADNLSSSISLATSADVVVYGTDTGDVDYGDRLGRSVAAGDVNGDGYDDMILGSSWANPDGRINAGQTYVIYGGVNISSTILLSDTTSSNIRVLGDDGVACDDQNVDDCGDEAGRAVSAGDINNDGADDVIIGAVGANNGVLDDSGAAYLVYGEKAATILLAPSTDTITAGQSITYTLAASNTFGTWDISELGNYTIDPAANGSWVDNVYTGGISGTWTVTATFQGLTATATLTVERASAASLDLAPDPATITAGEAVTYTATASDAYGNDWDVTGTTVFTIADEAGGFWTDSVYTSENAATWTVTGTYQSLEDTASLTVEPLQLAFSSTAYEVAEDTGMAVITVTLSPTPLTQATVDYDTTNGSATAGSDYLAASGTLTFSPGTTELTFTVLITDDLVNENSENLNLTLSNPSGAASLSGDTAVLTITDNDTAGVTLTQSGGDTAVSESGSSDTYTVVLDSQPGDTVTITLTFNNSQLRVNGNTSPVSLTFAPGVWDTAQIVTVTAVDDALDEGTPHTYFVSHSASSSDSDYNGTGLFAVDGSSGNTIMVNITDNDSAGVQITESGGSTNVTEGGATDTYQVVLNTQPTASVTVTISDSQVDTSPTSVVFTPGNWSIPVAITVNAEDDDMYESNHTGNIAHTATSSDSDYNGISIAGITANITDNDSPPTLTVSDLTVSEGVGTANMEVTLSGSLSLPVSVNYTVSDGTATGGSVDYSATNGTLNWSVGQSGALTVPITITNDTSDEPAETVNLSISLSAPISVTIVMGTGVLTIIDNDLPAAPHLITPTNNITVTTATPTFVWEDGGGAQTGVVSYTLVITGSTQPTPTIVATIQPVYTPTIDLDAGVYTWTVRAHDAEGNAGNYASPENFLVDPAGGSGTTIIYLPVVFRN